MPDTLLNLLSPAVLLKAIKLGVLAVGLTAGPSLITGPGLITGSSLISNQSWVAGDWMSAMSTAMAQSTSTNLPRLADPSGADISPGTERRIGEAIVRQMLVSGEILEDWDIRDYLARLSAPLLATDAARGFNFEFFPVRDISINAFALPGGYVGVHAGLVLAAQTESELASVLAHEVGHITQRHVSRMVAKSKQASITSIAGAILAALAVASNPQAAVGVALLGGSLAEDQMLAFTRDAEREADRVGFDMLSQANFEPGGMLQFFNRLQQANRLVDVGIPVYLRSHPLTSERISDVQSRVALMRYKQRADSIDFLLVRAKLRNAVPLPANVVRGNPSLLNEDHRRATLSFYERQVIDKEANLKPDAWFGLAIARRAMKDYVGARQALVQARKRLLGPSVFIEHEAVVVELESGQQAQALSLVDLALKQFASPRSLVHLKAKVLMRGDAQLAQDYLEDQVRVYRGDQVLWNTLSELHFQQQRELAGHRTRAEAYACLGMWLPAMDQLRIAQRFVKNDYYNGSQIDARLKEFERNYLQDQQAKI